MHCTNWFLAFLSPSDGTNGVDKWEIDKCRIKKTTLNSLKYKSETRFIDTVTKCL
jgi:hypothetical protein